MNRFTPDGEAFTAYILFIKFFQSMKNIGVGCFRFFRPVAPSTLSLLIYLYYSTFFEIVPKIFNIFSRVRFSLLNTL